MSHVLFVDDDVSNLVVWEAACADEFKVLSAPGAEAALELMARYEVGVLLSDLRMPGVSGIELLERVRATHPSTVRILITAHSDHVSAIDAINRGHVRRYLRKPCPLHELRAALRDAMEYYDLRVRFRAMERRQLVTESVYALGLVASGLGRELVRPTESIRATVSLAREEIRELTERFQSAQVDGRIVRAKLAELEDRLTLALDGVERVMTIAESVAMPGPDGALDDVQLSEVLRAALRIVRGEIRHRVDIELDLAEVPSVKGSGSKLNQVVLNLLVNAIEASTDAASHGLVKVCLRRNGSSVHLEVSDNGPDIPLCDLPHLFDPFHTSPSRRGTGIGLALSKTIVEEMGGRIEAANHPSGGAFFRVVLPATTALGGGAMASVVSSEH